MEVKFICYHQKLSKRQKAPEVRLFSCRRFPQNIAHIYPRADMCLPFSALKIFLLHKPPTREIYMSISCDVKITINSYSMYYVYFYLMRAKLHRRNFCARNFCWYKSKFKYASKLTKMAKRIFLHRCFSLLAFQK